jgi:hypothetical protein
MAVQWGQQCDDTGAASATVAQCVFAIGVQAWGVLWLSCWSGVAAVHCESAAPLAMFGGVCGGGCG